MVRRGVTRELPPGFAVDTHFNPRYDPWDQRVCLVPDGDLFKALGDGTASVVTDEIETFTEAGLKLRSGTELEADIVVAATGLDLQVIGGMQLAVDGREVVIPETMAYKGMMLSGVPNFAFTVGYTNASWTLKADLTPSSPAGFCATWTSTATGSACPRAPTRPSSGSPILDFTSGYVQRAIHRFPQQGDREPWRLKQNYAYDVRLLRRGPLEDGVLRFSSPVPAERAAAAAA